MLNLIVIKTKELERLKCQYEVLGLNFEYHRHGKGPFHYACEIDQLVFEIYPLPRSKEKADDTTRLGFVVTELDLLLPKLESSFWKIISMPTDSEWGYSCLVQDLDGRKVMLTQAEPMQKN